MVRTSRIQVALCVLVSLLLNGGLLWMFNFVTLNGARDEAARQKRNKVATVVTAPPAAPLLLPDEIVMGKTLGQGESVNETVLDELQTALHRSDTDQANQTRDVTGRRPGTRGGPSAMQTTFAPPPESLPAPPPSPAVAPRKYEKPQPETPQPPRDGRPVVPPPPTQPPEATPPPAAPSQPGIADAGTPARHSDRDSDRFGRETALDYRDGKVVAQNGREIKFAKPRDNLAALVDTATINFPARLVLHLRIDENGRIRYVQVVRSTGSRGLDRMFELAAYESWIEPLKNKAGQPIPDEGNFPMTIN